MKDMEKKIGDTAKRMVNFAPVKFFFITISKFATFYRQRQTPNLILATM